MESPPSIPSQLPISILRRHMINRKSSEIPLNPLKSLISLYPQTLLPSTVPFFPSFRCLSPSTSTAPAYPATSPCACACGGAWRFESPRGRPRCRGETMRNRQRMGIETIGVCLKMVYTPNYSHLVGIMIINHWV